LNGVHFAVGKGEIFFLLLLIAQFLFLVEKLKDIVKGCLKNDRQMQSELYKMFAPKMYGLCLRYSANIHDAQDLLQEGFVKVYDNLENFKWKGSLEGWMKRIFVNLALDKYRSKVSLLSIDDVAENQEPSDNELNALDSISEKEILELIRQLPDQYRMVFNLYVIEGYSHKELGEMLKIRESTSRSNLARAKMILKEKIQFHSRKIEKAVCENGKI
jgi:RNA polymerase sigma-70 factor (ECF subfamily)